MQLYQLQAYCMALTGVTETLPFGPTTLVYKVGGKMFLACNLTDIVESINVKCDPEMAIALREQYSAVLPGYHMSKKHWNTILLNGTIAHKLIHSWINNSYDLVVASLPAKVRVSLQ